MTRGAQGGSIRGVRVGVDEGKEDKLGKRGPAELRTDPRGVETTGDQRIKEDEMREKF